MINIDLNHTYEAKSVSKNFKNFSFNSILNNGEEVEIHVFISTPTHTLLPNLYNLSFGPLDKNGEINYKAKLNHKNTNKVFSTILLFAIGFLQTSKENNYAIGIDGTNKTKARFYHMMFKQNHKHLSDLISIAGVDCHANMLWRTNITKDNPDKENNGFSLFKSKPEPFDLNRKTSDLYQYYIFSLI